MNWTFSCPPQSNQSNNCPDGFFSQSECRLWYRIQNVSTGEYIATSNTNIAIMQPTGSCPNNLPPISCYQSNPNTCGPLANLSPSCWQVNFSPSAQLPNVSIYNQQTNYKISLDISTNGTVLELNDNFIYDFLLFTTH